MTTRVISSISIKPFNNLLSRNCVDSDCASSCSLLTCCFFVITDVDECSTTYPCQNSGVCNNIVGSYECVCTGTGYSGTDCDVGMFSYPSLFLLLLNTLHWSRSENFKRSGVCNNVAGSYECVCTGTGYSGIDCDVGMLIINLFVTVSVSLRLAYSLVTTLCNDSSATYLCEKICIFCYQLRVFLMQWNFLRYFILRFCRILLFWHSLCLPCNTTGVKHHHSDNWISLFVDEDECSLGTHSCANSGTCVNTAGSYTCDCTGTGYSGSDCSTGKYFIGILRSIQV